MGKKHEPNENPTYYASGISYWVRGEYGWIDPIRKDKFDIDEEGMIKFLAFNVKSEKMFEYQILSFDSNPVHQELRKMCIEKPDGFMFQFFNFDELHGHLNIRFIELSDNERRLWKMKAIVGLEGDYIELE